MVNHIANCEFGEDWQFGKEPYSCANPPPVVSHISLLFCLLHSRLRLLIFIGFSDLEPPHAARSRRHETAPRVRSRPSGERR